MAPITRTSSPTVTPPTTPAAGGSSAAKSSGGSDADFSKVVADTIVNLASKQIMNQIKELSSDTFQAAD